MDTAASQEFYALYHKMRERNIIRLSKFFFMHLSGRVEALAAEHNMPEMKVHYFGFLYNLQPEGTTSRDLAEKLKVSKQAISKMTQEIHQLGYIEFHPHETDRRASVIRLTEKGMQMLRTGMQVSEQIKTELEEKVGKKNMDQMIETLKKVVDVQLDQ